MFARSRERCASQGTLVESAPKVLFVELPTLLVSANQKDREASSMRSQGGTVGLYECPVFKYAARQDRYLVFSAHLNCPNDKKKGPSHWGLRGVAMLCNIE